MRQDSHIPEGTPVSPKLEGSGFVARKYQPKDARTAEYVECFAKELGLWEGARPTTQQKYLKCISDVIVAAKQAGDGLICWQMDANQFSGSAYGRDKADTVREALIKQGYLELLQKGFPGSSAVYQIDKSIFPTDLKFIEHDQTPLIEVRDSKPDYFLRNGRKPKGRRVPLKSFSGAHKPLEKQMQVVVSSMEKAPLTAPEGTQWTRCHRIFNDGRLDRGGRVYGGWQSRKATERLTYTIDGEQVVEVDIKASYLFLASRLAGSSDPLPTDPYAAIPFVQERKGLRDLAKQLVSAILSKPERPTKFPRGSKKDEAGRIISVRDQFGLGNGAKVDDYLNDIFRAFPFLKQFQGRSGELMFMESQLILEAMETLASRSSPVVVYPVHDCLICKKSDEQQVVSTLQDVMRSNLGAAPTLETEYPDGKTQIHDGDQQTTSGPGFMDWYLEDDDECLVIEEDS